MNILSKSRLVAVLAVAGLAGIVQQTWARPSAVPANERRSTLKTTAAQCNPANANIDLDINNVRARLMTGGDMWWDRGTQTAKYEIPKGSGKSSLFAGSVWVGGYDAQNALKVAAQTYRTRGNDYWPGPTQVDLNNVNSAPDKTICSDWDKFWKINKADLIDFREYFRRNGKVPTGSQYQSIIEWPATGNYLATGTSGLPLAQLTDNNYRAYGRNFAPFVNVGGDPNLYEPEQGDYPDIVGDQYIWWVFNDMGNIKLQTGTNAIGMEVQTSAFAYSSKDFLNDASFVFYKLINRGTLTLYKTYMATWTDADLGQATDDYVGCDTLRSLGILYNGKSIDGNGGTAEYGSQVPMIGVDFFIGPKRRTYRSDGKYNGPNGRYNEDTLGMTVFNYFNNDASVIGDPTNGLETYRVMTGYNRAGQHLKNDVLLGAGSNGYGAGPEVNFVYFGNPNVPGDWSECSCNKVAGDRRFVHSSGPFTLEAGGITNDIIIGACWVPNVGGCPNTSFSRIRSADDAIQDLFDNHFKTIEGPEAPRLVVREMDRKLLFYIVNDPSSTNYQERFGYQLDDPKYRVSTPRTRRFSQYRGSNGDSLYRFEGYRVFQLKNSTVTVNNIFNERGEVNTALAQEVFQTDIKNGIKGNIVNYVRNPDVSSSAMSAQVKVTNKDSGIVHSFQLTNDAFSNSLDKQFVNYRSYYFVAIAYAYNNFRDFTNDKIDSTQETPYLESAHTAGGRTIPVVEAMPNPANGDYGTVVNSDYGSGIIIKRLEGIGNGGLSTTFDSATEAEALMTNGVRNPVYVAGGGPVNIKVIDPRLVPAQDWELYITGPSGADSTVGLQASGSGWHLITGKDTIYSERDLSTTNEQIIEKYGLSVAIHQAARPGDADTTDNGYINSTISYANSTLAWLGGVNDQEQMSPLNWIRSGAYENPAGSPCNYADKGIVTGVSHINPDPKQVYENLLFASTPNRGTWAPVTLAAIENSGDCGFGVSNLTISDNVLQTLPGVDIVFTSDKSKWTRSVVLEMQDAKSLADGHAGKLTPRSHQSWDGDVDNDGHPVYSKTKGDTGFSWFPGYAINQETGVRMNIVFGEDSYLKQFGGNDMIWNPTADILDPTTRSVIFGGKHYVYILDSKYDSGKHFAASFNTDLTGLKIDYAPFQWVGLPTLLGNQKLRSIQDGLIPTETRIRIRVTKPYGSFISDPSQTLRNNGLPLYTFSTKGLAPKPLTDADNAWNNDKQALLDKIHVSPNPYYGYVQYENSRLDTRVRIVNLPRTATINIYSLDGTLVRTLTKDNPNQSFVDWDTRNAKGLSIASGMYLVHVKADGIGETIIRWFGAMRPVDIVSY